MLRNTDGNGAIFFFRFHLQNNLFVGKHGSGDVFISPKFYFQTDVVACTRDFGVHSVYGNVHLPSAHDNQLLKLDRWRHWYFYKSTFSQSLTIVHFKMYQLNGVYNSFHNCEKRLRIHNPHSICLKTNLTIFILTFLVGPKKWMICTKLTKNEDGHFPNR